MSNNEKFLYLFTGITIVSALMAITSAVLLFFDKSNLPITLLSLAWFIVGRIGQEYFYRKTNRPPSAK